MVIGNLNTRIINIPVSTIGETEDEKQLNSSGPDEDRANKEFWILKFVNKINQKIDKVPYSTFVLIQTVNIASQKAEIQAQQNNEMSFFLE